jgi:predicted PurR-regulated permease PerM
MCAGYPSEAREEKGDGCVGCLMDLTVLKLPHMIAVLMSLVILVLLLVILMTLVYNEVTTLTADPEFIDALDAAMEDFMDSLNESGIEIVDEPPNRYCYWPRWCPADYESDTDETALLNDFEFGEECRDQTILSVWDEKYIGRRDWDNTDSTRKNYAKWVECVDCHKTTTTTTVNGVATDEDTYGPGWQDNMGNTAATMAANGHDIFEEIKNGVVTYIAFVVPPAMPMTCTLSDGTNCEGDTSSDDYPISPTCLTPTDVGVIGGIIGAAANAIILVLLLWIFIISEAVEKTMFSEENLILSQIEVEVKFYITLKTAISIFTGILVTFFLAIFGVPLSTVFGLLAFVLNFIPNIGSMIAIILPIPVIIVWEPAGGADWKKYAALGSIAMVEMIVGNVVEPVLFGSALNMTALAVLGGLVMWGSIWGIMGAILSVPMLSIQKVVLIHSNHPYAKYALMMIRDDPLLDEKDLNIAGEDTVDTTEE